MGGWLYSGDFQHNKITKELMRLKVFLNWGYGYCNDSAKHTDHQRLFYESQINDNIHSFCAKMDIETSNNMQKLFQDFGTPVKDGEKHLMQAQWIDYDVWSQINDHCDATSQFKSPSILSVRFWGFNRFHFVRRKPNPPGMIVTLLNQPGTAMSIQRTSISNKGMLNKFFPKVMFRGGGHEHFNILL